MHQRTPTRPIDFLSCNWSSHQGRGSTRVFTEASHFAMHQQLLHRHQGLVQHVVSKISSLRSQYGHNFQIWISLLHALLGHNPLSLHQAGTRIAAAFAWQRRGRQPSLLCIAAPPVLFGQSQPHSAEPTKVLLLCRSPILVAATCRRRSFILVLGTEQVACFFPALFNKDLLLVGGSAKLPRRHHSQCCKPVRSDRVPASTSNAVQLQ